MRPHISIRGYVGPSVRHPLFKYNVIPLTNRRRFYGRSGAMPALPPFWEGATRAVGLLSLGDSWILGPYQKIHARGTKAFIE